jgi:hypothetical protein
MMPNIPAPMAVAMVIMAHNHRRGCDERRRDEGRLGRRRRRWWRRRRTTSQDTKTEKT